MNRLSTLAAAIALASAGGASSAHAAEQCFSMNAIVASRAADDRTVYLRVGVDDIYRLDLRTDCPNLQGGKLIVRSVSGSGQICRPIDIDLKVADQGFRSACVADAITKLTPAQAAALPSKVRP